jgi:hypothetical protein
LNHHPGKRWCRYLQHHQPPPLGIISKVTPISQQWTHNTALCQKNATSQTTRQPMYVKRNTGVRSRNHCRRRKAVSITYSECVPAALVIQHAKCTRHIILSSVACLGCTILSSVACLALPYCHLWPVWLYDIVICGLSGSTILSSVACLALPYCHLWPVWLYHIVTCGLSGSTILSSLACLAVPYCHLSPVWLYHIVICRLSGSTILSSVACLALPYCHLWPVWLYHIVTCGLSGCTKFLYIFRKKKLLDIKCVLRFSLQICLKHFSL